MAFDPSSDHLLAANVSRQDDPSPITLSIVDTKEKILAADIIVPVTPLLRQHFETTTDSCSRQ